VPAEDKVQLWLQDSLHHDPVLELLSTGVVELDANGRIQFMNAAAENCLATSREQVRGQCLDELTGVPVALNEAISATINDNRSRHLRECKLADGLYDCNIQNIPDQHLLLEFYSLKWQRQQSNLEQREVQTGMMDLLRRNLGHEIRNPLGGIRGAAQLMAAELNGGELGTLANLIMREVDRVNELLERFGRPELELSQVDVHWVLQEISDLLQSESTANVRIIHDYDPSIPAISADASALRQLFLNLGRNALQAGATDITLRSRVVFDSALLKPGIRSVLRVDVVDNGCGVPDSLRKLLFMPMVTSRRDGTGLGLALAQQIAAAHDGLLTYESMTPGSRFALNLPLRMAHD
jgi:two-component system nitrogen regulation sensor histidine kinase GlnL